VNPRPRITPASENSTTPPPIHATATYASVPTTRTPSLSRNDTRRPLVSATTPVGTSNSAMAAVNAAFATNTSKTVSPASRRKSVLIPQISEADRVNSAVMTRYVRMMR
jgi:hypothetical protein